MKIYIVSLLLFMVTVCGAQTSTSDIWLNEFHYDHVTSRGNSDTAEFIELAIKTAIASDNVELTKYSVILYTAGALDQTAFTLGRGLPYNVASSWYTEAETVFPLTTFFRCSIVNSEFSLLYKKMPVLQDVPTAIAIVYNNTTVVQLLSYEKAFKIAPAARGGGIAAETMTELVINEFGQPASETASTAPRHSISLLGTGKSYGDFYWSSDPLVNATPCAVNNNTATTQNFSSALPVRWLSVAARGNKNTVYTEWSVATEAGVSKYIVELLDANGNLFTTVEMPYDRNANGKYRVNVPNVKNGQYQVRIKSQMITGATEYSATKLVRLSDQVIKLASVYPNPVKGGVANVTIITDAQSAYTIELIDGSGKRISSTRSAVLQANTLNKIEVPVRVAPAYIPNKNYRPARSTDT